MWSSYTLRKIKSALGEYRHRRVPKVQVLGERCSGTNFTEALLLENLPVHEGHSFGWKHGFPAFLAAAPDTVYVVVYREVFGWLKSMYDKPWHAVPVVAALTFSEFIRAEWHSTVDERFQLAADDPANHQILQQDRHPITGQPPRNLLELRKWKAEALLGLSARGSRLCIGPMIESSLIPWGWSAMSRGFTTLRRRTRYVSLRGTSVGNGTASPRHRKDDRRRSRPKIARSFSPISTMTSKRNSVSAILSTSNDLPDHGHL